ncbi:RNA polymerase sigma factor [Krasilnikovia sp. M28-CT-15]|uniref:RNA polymerase sigma factor n=1 Tax=Krasilnikovia sp. M28-CT-15 TaxID=3373540 RepID=UPI00387635D1
MWQRVRRRREGLPPWVENTGRIRAVLCLGGVPWQDLDDALQQVRLKVLERQAASGEPVRDPDAFAAVVASRVAVDWHRGAQRQQRLAQRLAARADDGSGAATGTDRDLAVMVAQLLDELPAAQRQLVVLRFFADLSVPQIAEQLGIAVGTVKSRLHAAVSRMRVRMEAQEVSWNG